MDWAIYDTIKKMAVKTTQPTTSIQRLQPPHIMQTSDLPVWRVSVARYHQMIDVGALTEADNLELLDGILVEKMTIKPSHAFATDELYAQLLEMLPTGVYVRSEKPITLSDSEPEPDLAVVHGTRRDYVAHHPAPEHVLCVIEVSDATIYQDRHQKKMIYARAGIAMYWIVNLRRERVELFTKPADGDYKQCVIYLADAAVPVTIAGKQVGEIKVADILP